MMASGGGDRNLSCPAAGAMQASDTYCTIVNAEFDIKSWKRAATADTSYIVAIGMFRGKHLRLSVLPSSTKCAVVYWTLDSMLTVSSPPISSLVINRRNPEIRFMKRPHVDAMRCLLPDLTLEHSRKVSRTEHPPGRGLANV